MQPTSKLLRQLKADYPHITYEQGDDFLWSAGSATIIYRKDTHGNLLLLHELGHAIHSHSNFVFDIDLIAQERQAWDTVRNGLAASYDIALDEAYIEETLDTYRDWLYARSICPRCMQTGLQTKTSTYVCINCRCSWRPNDARRCALRRYKITSG